ncbi:unnamed protein product [[Actinomadura] parvosata subsp. kistnae]|nr:unnamed protein product [Actinomadura parvosata subsp. kistnae]
MTLSGCGKVIVYGACGGRPDIDGPFQYGLAALIEEQAP